MSSIAVSPEHFKVSFLEKKMNLKLLRQQGACKEVDQISFLLGCRCFVPFLFSDIDKSPKMEKEYC